MKKQHIGVIPGLDKFVAEYVADKAMGKDGYLSRKGLVPLPAAEAEAVRKARQSAVEPVKGRRTDVSSSICRRSRAAGRAADLRR